MFSLARSSLLLLSLSSLLAAQNTTSTSPSASPSNSTSEIQTSITLPPLYSCSPSSWVYTAPLGPKYLGFFVSGTNEFIETYALPDAYTERTEGTFVWNCDLPPGLSVAAMFYVIQDGASGTNGRQTTTPDALINAGSSSDQCYGNNDPGSRRGILSLASSLDPSFSYTANPASASNGANPTSNNSDSGSSTPVGAIIGGVLGGLALIIVLALLLIYLRRKHDAALLRDDGSVYSGWTEKTRRGSTRMGHGIGEGGGGGNLPPQGTYYATDPEGNTILVMGQPPHPSSTPPPHVQQQHQQAQAQHPMANYNASTEPSVLDSPMGNPSTPHSAAIPMNGGGGVGGGQGVPRMTAPMGTLPEPMGDEGPPRTAQRPAYNPSPSVATTATGFDSYHTAGTPGSATPIPRAFDPRSEREGYFNDQRGGGGDAYEGLADPDSFARGRNALRR